jgi:GNAT superfamily N-acetyltransferase
VISRPQRSDIEIDDDLDRIEFARVHTWLASTYWSPDIPRERVERAARHSSLVIGAYRNGEQVGYLRVVSDRTTFAYLCDVFVDERHRGQGVARAMVRHALSHPEHQGLRRWLLATRDAHPVYRGVGFKPLPNPERWMTVEGQAARPATAHGFAGAAPPASLSTERSASGT